MPVENRKRKAGDSLMNKTGGAYLPPAKLKKLQEQITDKASVEYQRISWEALKKSINGLINKLNVSNIAVIVEELFKENLIRGKGVLMKSIMQAQSASPSFTSVHAALISVVNTKFPFVGETLLHRLVIQFKSSLTRNNKAISLTTCKFIGHLFNCNVVSEILPLEIITLLLENATEDSVEISVDLVKVTGVKMSKVCPRGLQAMFERLRAILHEARLHKRVQYMIDAIFLQRKEGFKDFPAVCPELDLIEEEAQFTHVVSLQEEYDKQEKLNVFQFDPDYIHNEQLYEDVKKNILGEESEADEESSEEEGEEEEASEENFKKQEIVDATQGNLLSLRKTIYLTLKSSLHFEEACHKLIKLNIPPHLNSELCNMILDCCAQERSFEKFYALLAQRFCALNRCYSDIYVESFQSCYDTIHRFETNKLRNCARFFSHLLYTDSVPWNALSHIRLTEDDTTSSSRIFTKILFQDLTEFMGLPKLNDRIKDPTLNAFEGLFPRDNPKNTIFAINFFTSIGLGGLTEDLRKHHKSKPKKVPEPIVEKQGSEVSKSSSSDSSSSDSSSDTDNSSDSDNSSSSSSKNKRSSKKQTSQRNSSKKESSINHVESTRKINQKESSRKDRSEQESKDNSRKEYENRSSSSDTDSSSDSDSSDSDSSDSDSSDSDSSDSDSSSSGSKHKRYSKKQTSQRISSKKKSHSRINQEESTRKTNQKESSRNYGSKQESKAISSKEYENRSRKESHRNDRSREESPRNDRSREESKDRSKKEYKDRSRKESSRKDRSRNESKDGSRKESSRKDRSRNESKDGSRKESSRKDRSRNESKDGSRKESSRKDRSRSESKEGSRNKSSRKDISRNESKDGSRKESSRNESKDGSRKESSRKDRSRSESKDGSRKESSRNESKDGSRKESSIKDKSRSESKEGSRNKSSRKDISRNESKDGSRKESSRKDRSKRDS